MGGRSEEGFGGRPFDDAPGVHHGHGITDLCYHRNIMCDQDHRQVEFPLKFAQDLKDLMLYDDVEGGDRLICDQQAWFERERHGDDRPLLHTAGEFVRVVHQALGIQAD